MIVGVMILRSNSRSSISIGSGQSWLSALLAGGYTLLLCRLMLAAHLEVDRIFVEVEDQGWEALWTKPPRLLSIMSAPKVPVSPTFVTHMHSEGRSIGSGACWEVAWWDSFNSKPVMSTSILSKWLPWSVWEGEIHCGGEITHKVLGNTLCSSRRALCRAR